MIYPLSSSVFSLIVCVHALPACMTYVSLEIQWVFRRMTSTMQQIGANDSYKWKEGNLAAGFMPN